MNRQGYYLYSDRPFAEAVKARRTGDERSRVITSQFKDFAQYQFCRTGFRSRQYDDHDIPPRGK